MRKASGLRNRWRRGKGRGAYSRLKKGRLADRYGSWLNGHRSGGEVIAGRAMTYKAGV